MRAGNANGWQPHEPSAAAATWRQAATPDEPLALTAVEADVHGTLLVRSSLEHGALAADVLSRGRPVAPHTVARTAVEHGLRGIYHLQHDVDDTERAVRRLLEWLYAVQETERLVQGTPLDIEPSGQRAQVQARAGALGLDVGKEQVAGRKRVSTMKLAEMYLAGERGRGVPNLLVRRSAAAAHGLETGLLSAVTERVGLAGVNVMDPAPAPVKLLVLDLLTLPLAALAGMREIILRYGWDEQTRELQILGRQSDVCLDLWRASIEETVSL